MPFLAGQRRVITFDFLGWGESDKPAGYPYTAHNQTGDLDAVITRLGLDEVVLVAHDASGSPAIDWALVHPERVAALVLLTRPALAPAAAAAVAQRGDLLGREPGRCLRRGGGY